MNTQAAHLRVTSCLLFWGMLVGVAPLSATSLSGVLNSDRTIRAADSPVTITADLSVPEGRCLTIEAGVEVRLSEGVCVLVEGELQALGQKQFPIRFLPAEDGVRWGNVKLLGSKDEPGWDEQGDWIPDSHASRLLHCEFLGGGRVPDLDYDGGAVYLRGSSGVIRDCLFRDNQAERGGGLVCYNFAQPWVEGCTFEDNRALLDDGGAIYCFLYADARIRRNFIVHNRAERHGGGIYISNSSPEIRENALIDNTAGQRGGAIFVSGSATRILDNAIYEHKAGEETTGLVFQADCRPEVSGNSLLSGGVEVSGLNLSYDIDLADNWWGSINDVAIASKIVQRSRGLSRHINFTPWLDKPTGNLLTQPVEINNLSIMADESWRDTLRFDMVQTAVIRVQVRAIDRNPYAVDQTSTLVQVAERPDQQFMLILKESEKASGIFRGEFALSANYGNMDRLDALVGEHIIVRSSINEDVAVCYRVDEARPVIHDLAITSDPDPTHMTADRLSISWEYYSLLGGPQEAWQLQVGRDSLFNPPSEWDSGPTDCTGGIRNTDYRGRRLEDGERYFFRARVRSNNAWSDWARFMVRSDNTDDYSFRLNSLPPVPALLKPSAEEILPTFTPVFEVERVTDREGDTVSYDFQLAEDSFFTRIIESSETKDLREPKWQPETQLRDNGSYFWRVRVRDGYEEGAWSTGRRFYLNPVEEAPLAFALLEPRGAIADVLPTFAWQQSLDPDPGSSVSYTFLIATKQDLSDAERIPGVQILSYQKRAELANRSSVYWAVDAVDNSGRVTRSSEIWRLDVDTTPSVPSAVFPSGEEEMLAAQVFGFQESTDPWPQDVLSYEVQISGDGSFTPPLLKASGLAAADLRQMAIDGYPDAERLNDDQKYFWRLRAIDNHNAASDWSRVRSFYFNRFNNPPEVPQLLQPLADAVVSEDPLLVWSVCDDPDFSDPAESLVYTLQCCPLADFRTAVVEHALPAGTQLNLMKELADNQLWYWRVSVRDNEAASSGWSQTHSFVLNRMPDAPRPFALQQPTEGESLYRLDGIGFNWTPSSDPDWASSISYKWTVASDAALRQVLAEGETEATEASARCTFTSGSDYYLGVSAVDDTGLSTPCTVRRFHVDSRPNSPAFDGLAQMDEVGSNDVLRWTAAEDPDPRDRLLYRITLRDTQGRALVDVADLPQTEVTLGRLFNADKLVDNQRITAELSVSDPHGLSNQAAPVSFWFNRSNDAPSAPSWITALATERVFQTLNPELEFTPGEDPDPLDGVANLSHELQIASSAEFNDPRVTRLDPGISRLSNLRLGDNQRWFLRLRTLDRAGAASAWTEPVHLVVNLVEDAPTAPVIQNPPARTVAFDLTGLTVQATASVDPDVDSSLRYRAELYQGSERLASAEGDTPNLRITHPMQNKAQYSVILVALDNTGRSTPSSRVDFSVDSTPGETMFTGIADGSVVGPTDRVSWTAAVDPDPQDVIRYELQASRRSDFVAARSYQVNTTSFTLSQLAEVAEENGALNLRVRALDDQDLQGPWSRELALVWDAVNETPVWQGTLSPASGILRSNEPTISWQQPLDPDRRPQRLTVTVEIAADESFNETLTSRNFTAADGSGQLPARENNERWMRARVTDQGGLQSEWSPVVHYIVNATEEAPSAPVLNGPADGARVRGSQTFRWQAASDPDPGDQLSYHLELTGATSLQRVTESNSIELDVSQLPAGDYRWQVIAIDRTGNQSKSTPRALRVVGPPEMSLELREGTVLGVTDQLSWRITSDLLQGEQPTIEIELTPADGGTIIRKEARGTTLSMRELAPQLEENQWYSLRARARGNQDITGSYTAPVRVGWDRVNDAPQWKGISGPAEGLLRTSEPTLSWQQPEDADLRPQRLQVRVDIATDAGFEDILVSKNYNAQEGSASIRLRENNERFVRVRVFDQDDAVSDWSKTMHYIINEDEEAPSAPQLLQPSGRVTPGQLSFRWRESSDPDPGAELRYQLVLTDQNGGSQSFDLEDTSFQHELTVGNWRWQVIAIDNTGLRTPSSERDLEVRE